MAGSDPADHVMAVRRYSTVVIVLHWLIAAAILFQLLLGWRLDGSNGDQRTAILQLHKSIGITLLLLMAVRLFWRWRRPPPPVEGFGRLEQKLSGWVHLGLYVALVGLPLSGWAIISASAAKAKIKLFGSIPWPKLPILPDLPDRFQDFIGGAFGNAHTALAWVLVGLFMMHLAGALKHQFVSRDGILARMLPGVSPGRALDARLAGVAVIALIMAVAPFAVNAPSKTDRPKPENLAAADLYQDIVQPSLSRRCASCHDNDRARGGLSVVDHQTLMDGGKSGAAVHPGAPLKSGLVRRIMLPASDERFMPKDGKTPLSSDERAAINYWIAKGAPASLRLANAQIPKALRPALLRILGLTPPIEAAGDRSQQSDLELLPKVPAADPAAIQAARSAGFVVRPVVQGSNLLDVAITPLKTVSDADIGLLRRLGSQIHYLNLAQAGVTDAQLKMIGGFTNVVNLKISGNPVTDAGAGGLKNLDRLVSINVYGTKLTNAGLAQLASMPHLKRIYAWQSAVVEDPKRFGALVVVLEAKAVHDGQMSAAGQTRQE